MSQKKVSATISVTAVIDGQDGQDGVSITSANVFYALSNQGPTGTPPADSAFTYDDFPNGNLQPGYYVWQATVVTFSNGSSEVTGKICLGATTDFLQGTEVYAVSQSGTNPPADGELNWKTTYTRQQGYYLWTATRVTYTNGTVAYLHKKCVGYWGTDGTDGQDGQDGQDGVSITSANVFYALSDQGPKGTPPDNTAFTYDDFPNGNLTPGYYVWQATVVTFSNGSSEVTGKICLGATTDFLQGTEVYAVSQSGTNPPADGTTNWKTTYTRQQGYYLWTATRVTYTDAQHTVAYLHKKCVGYWGTDGTDGDETPVYSIIPSPAAVNFRSNAVGDFLPASRSVSVVVRKVTSSGSASLSPSNNVIDGKYYLYCYDEESAAWYRFTNGSNYLSQVVTAADALDGTITTVRFALSTASSSDGITANNTVAEAVVPVICDGHRGVQGEPGAPGAPGAMGKMFYPMGEWNAQTTYSRTGDFVPLVFLPDPGHYNEAIGAEGNCFYLYDDTSTGTRPSVNDQTGPWRLCNDFGVVITQGLFAEFAKMGKGIFSGDYFFSMNGRIGNAEYRAGATIGGVPAYTRFCGDPSSLAGKVSVPSLSGPVSTDVYTIASVRLQPGVTFRATIVGRRTSSSGSYSFVLRDANGVTRASTTLNSATETTKTLSYTVTTSTAGTFTLVCYGSNISVAVSFTADYGATGYFEPNWWVDLLTGKMSAARGNFVVDSNGDVHVKSGDVDVSGTIRATNLFRSTALCWGGGECCLLEPGGTTVTYLYIKSLDRTESPSLAAKYGFAIGDYFPYTDALKNSDDAGAFEDGMNNANYADNDFIPCTYSADIVELLDKPSSGTLWPTINGIVYLPLPSAFAGKMVEVRHNMTSGTGTASVRVVNLGSLITLYPELDEHGKLKVGGNSLSDQCTVNAGQIASFYSTGTYWVACGVVR